VFFEVNASMAEVAVPASKPVRWTKATPVPVTMKLAPLLATPETDTTTFPVPAPAGTLTVMLPVPQLDAVPAETPLKVTVLVLWVAPKFVPVIVTGVPTVPELGLSMLILGCKIIVKGTALLLSAPAVTITLPVIAPAGTVTPILVAVQLEKVVAAVPPKVTDPWVLPKLVPVIVIAVPTAPVG
jgi:hypothetical protein